MTSGLPTSCPACGWDQLDERPTGELYEDTYTLVCPACGVTVAEVRGPLEDDCE